MTFIKLYIHVDQPNAFVYRTEKIHLQLCRLPVIIKFSRIAAIPFVFNTMPHLTTKYMCRLSQTLIFHSFALEQNQNR